jgi:hypothetical protein
LDRHPERAQWANKGNHAKDNWYGNDNWHGKDNWHGNDNWHGHHHHGYFNNRFWAHHNVFFPWGYGYYWHGFRPWSYWWSYPSWNSCLGWFPGWGWNQPYYYDYGVGGNVIYYDDGVYVNNQPVGSPAEYAQSAAELAAVDRADIDPQAGGEWLPLGTFALAADQSDTAPRQVVQLAVDKQGIVSGTMYDETTDKTFPIQGRVNKDTQRVAFTIGDNPDRVLETGLYNLTQEQTPVLVHKGNEDTETNLLIRLKQPAQDQSQSPQAAPVPVPAPPPPSPPTSRER